MVPTWVSLRPLLLRLRLWLLGRAGAAAAAAGRGDADPFFFPAASIDCRASIVAWLDRTAPTGLLCVSTCCPLSWLVGLVDRMGGIGGLCVCVCVCVCRCRCSYVRKRRRACVGKLKRDRYRAFIVL
jgi:hypothetical protein